MKILFPCSQLDNKKVDEDKIEEHHAAKLQGHDCFLFDHDEYTMVSGKLKSNIPEVDDKTTLVLRGWQLTIPQYETLYEMLEGKGYTLINTPEQYKNCHHFPESYDYTKDYTSKAIFIKKWDAEVLQNISDFFEGKDFILKDYVKSEKQNPELFIMPGGISGEDLLERVEKFKEARGDDFSVGLVFKEFVDLKDYDGKINEWRLFFYEKRLVASYQDSNVKDGVKPSFAENPFIKDVASQIDSNFFTIDIAEKENGGWMIIETGDGQVSDFDPGQNALEFYAEMQGQLKSND